MIPPAHLFSIFFFFFYNCLFFITRIIKAAMDRMMTSYEAKLSSEKHKRRAQET